MTPNRRQEVPFPAMGEGYVLKFSNPDCDALQAEFGDNWFVGAFDRLNNFDVKFFKACVRLGARKDGKRVEIDFDSLDVPLMEIGEPIVDALYMCIHGKTLADFFRDQAKRAMELESGENPTSASSQESFSTTSASAHTGSA